MLMLLMPEFTKFEREKSINLYLHAKGIAATVRSNVRRDELPSFKLEKIIPAALFSISVTYHGIISYGGFVCDNGDIILSCIFFAYFRIFADVDL